MISDFQVGNTNDIKLKDTQVTLYLDSLHCPSVDALLGHTINKLSDDKQLVAKVRVSFTVRFRIRVRVSVRVKAKG